MSAPFQRFDVSRRGRVLQLARNNPGKMNRVDATLHHELGQVFRWADDDRASDVVVLTGHGAAF
ncbi:MAG: enoyl-CoA hydratase-related protein [Caulobacterales bacterium]|jgi:enoyl-CoA hydratase